MHQSKIQTQIWQQILVSQGLHVVVSLASLDLQQFLQNLTAANNPLPGLLLVDQSVTTFEAGAFCRWSQMTYPQLPVVLLSPHVQPVNILERQAAIATGAIDLLPEKSTAPE